ncbi:Tim44/TimA family putative adaptor protein [Aestuariivirga sp.]|uniref:Tim44/TimA family putative adaptor protein n=1 Tax=Aestuariivirga sp. TaxID=2650926 RepID=UPI00391AAC7C
MNIDPLNILLLAVALVVFWRLRSVLGTRTGMEKPPIEPFETKRNEAPKGQDANGTVVRFPQNGQTTSPAEATAQEPEEPVWSGYAAPGTELAGTLAKLAESDPSFTPRSFVEGAKMAYEMIVESFAKGDKPTLKNLLSREVFEGFSRAIDEREAQGRKVESRFVGIGKATIQSASLVGKRANITMEFVSELISATYDASGEVIEGDPKHIQEVTDVWTFERDVTSRNPNWKLVATQAPS